MLNVAACIFPEFWQSLEGFVISGPSVDIFLHGFIS